jgi:hypothetical protein
MEILGTFTPFFCHDAAPPRRHEFSLVQEEEDGASGWIRTNVESLNSSA